MCLKHKAFSVPIYQTKNRTQCKKTRTFYLVMTLDNFDVLKFILFGRYFVLLLSHMRHLDNQVISYTYVSWEAVIQQQKKRPTAHPAQKRRQLLENAHARMQGSEKVLY